MVVKEQTEMSDLCWKIFDRAQSCCGSETLCKNYATETVLLVSCLDRSKHNCCVLIFICLVKVKKEDKINKFFFLFFYLQNHFPP